MLKVSAVYISLVLAGIIGLTSCGANKTTLRNSAEVTQIQINSNADGPSLTVNLEKGKSHNHPTFAVWAEDLEENFIQTLFVTKSIATGIYGHGPLDAEKWDTGPGWQVRPAALPYWINKRIPAEGGKQLPDPQHPVPDAYTGATPMGSAALFTRLDNPMSGKIRILVEVNQPWDWNEFWTNKLYDDVDYRTSCQPSLVYAAIVDLDKPGKEIYLNPIGHGHYSGADGELYTDLRTITTAKDIFSAIAVSVKR